MKSASGSISLRGLLITLCLGALFIVVHTFALPLLPDTGRTLSVAEMRPTAGEGGNAFSVPFPDSADDAPNDRRSRVVLYEDGIRLAPHADIATLAIYGRGNYGHSGGELIFSATDNSDPRKNGRDYDVYYPLFYHRGLGYFAALLFALCAFALYRLPYRSQTASSFTGNFSIHVAAAAALFLLGLYCSTGTLAPYGNNGHAHVATSYKFIYNPDHLHFRTLFQFIDGQPRAVWDGALFLRRILFPVLTYPFMKIWGFEIGGAIGSLVLNTTAFVAFLFLLGRFIGARGTLFAGWLLALYPGAAYWGGLPYVYSIIFPACLLLTIGLLALRAAESCVRVVWVSLLMGVAYLGYDLIIFFLPVSLFVLLVRRQFVFAGLAVVCQVVPLAAWLYFLTHGLHQNLNNSNSAAFGVVLGSYAHLTSDLAGWWRLAHFTPGIALNVFFGSGFVFLPTLFLLIIVLNAVTSRIRVTSIEVGLLGLAAALFLFNNLAPDYIGPWQMRGTWIARIYQPVFPALVLFCARWFDALPPLSPRLRWSLGTAFVVLGLGNALVIFGPILNNPLSVSENVYFAFCDSMASHSLYEDNLRTMGRRPLGFRYHAP